MASGTIDNGSFTGPSSRSHARPQITWSSTTNTAGNYSNVTATLRFRRWQYWNSFNLNGHSVTITINGNSGSANRVFDLRNSSNYVVWSRTVRVNHGSDGKKTTTIGASGNTGVGLGSYNFSQSVTLDTIARASTLSKFSFNANLKNGTSNQINYTVDRKNSGFRHQIQLRDGGTTVRTWDNISSNGDSTLTLTSSEVNNLLNRIKTSTTKSFTLRIATRSGHNGGWIGSAVTRNATATVHADVKPSVSAVSLSQTGNPVSSHTLQGFSKIKASFTRSAGYGASISSSSIQVRRRSGGADSQTINSNSGTTSNPVSLNGVYEARGTTRDSRGRTTHTAWATITVTAYRAPTITNFSAVRNSSTPTTVNISRATTHTVLGSSNHMTYTVQRRQGNGAWTNVSTGATGTITLNPSSSTSSSTGNSVTSSYEFRYVVTDKLGGRAESIQTVSTQRVVLDIHKNEGVGIGKIHEEGVLDVDGSAYFHGPIYIPHIVTRNLGHSGNFNDADRTSFYHMGSSAEDNPSNTWGFLYTNTSASGGSSPATQVSQLFHERDGAQNLWTRAKTNGNWGPWKRVITGTFDRVLWAGAYYVTANHTVTPAKSLSQCARGWMLQWSRYTNSGHEDNNFTYTFIPKQHSVNHSGRGMHQIIGQQNFGHKTKYLYVSNGYFTGHSNNSGDGIVLRRVYEW